MTAAPKPSIQVVRVGDEHAEALAAFFLEAWGNGADAAAVREARAAAARANPVEPGADIPAMAYIRDGVVLGYLASIPVSFWNGSTELPAHWLKGFMVLPEHRGGPVGFAVLKEMLKHVTVSGIMTVAEPARRLFTAVGYKDCGVLPNYVTILRPERVAQKIDVANLGLGLPGWIDQAIRLTQRTGLAWGGGLVARGGLGVWRAIRSRGKPYSVETTGSLATREHVDGLWKGARTTLRAAAVRDWNMLSWRYAPAAGGAYESVNVYRGGTLRAIAIVRRPKGESDPRLRGIKMATVSDVLFADDEADAGRAAFAGAERVARRMGADAMLCSTTHPAIVSLLKRRAYVRLPGNVHLMLRDPKGAANLSTDVHAWWIMRGDAGSDDVF
jgi:GNAT superfamily N-acetyltransferase